MKETCKLLDAYIRNFNLNSEPLTSPLFFNQKGRRFRGMGLLIFSKNTFLKLNWTAIREKSLLMFYAILKAMHLLGAGVNMIYIRDFLGHVDISTTEVYARIDAEMKRKVFEESA